MRALTAADIIALWETAYRLHPIDQALTVLLRVHPEHDRDALAALPLGQRDALLLALRAATFGDALAGQSNCPQCGETVEFALSCAALSSTPGDAQHQRLDQDGYGVTVRPLNSFDLAAAAAESSAQGARTVLLQRCVLAAAHQGKTIEAATLPSALETRITQAALAADPQAEKLLDLHCPDCGHPWQTLLDIGHILWLEIAARAQRLLLEVHLLARAYGWREVEILELSPARRASYLQLVTA